MDSFSDIDLIHLSQALLLYKQQQHNLHVCDNKGVEQIEENIFEIEQLLYQVHKEQNKRSEIEKESYGEWMEVTNG